MFEFLSRGNLIQVVWRWKIKIAEKSTCCLIAFTLLFVGTAYAAVPSVVEVEKTIASEDYTKSQEQLGEIIKLTQIVLLQLLSGCPYWKCSRRQPSVEYKLTEDRLAKLEKSKLISFAAENKTKKIN